MPFMTIPSLSQSKQSQLFQSASEKPFYVHIEYFYIDKKTNVAYYTIQIGVLVENKVVVHNLAMRYSQLEKLNRKLHEQFPNNVEFPAFPPKKYIFNTSIDFLQKRYEDLNLYLSSLSSISCILDSVDFRKTFGI